MTRLRPHGPLDAETADLAGAHPDARAHLHQAWRDLVPGARFPLTAASMGAFPLVASRALEQALTERVSAMVDALQPRWSAATTAPPAPALDILCLDLAIAKDATRGWTLRWVEVQAFTSLIATVLTLSEACGQIWPRLHGRRLAGVANTGAPWRAAVHQFVVPSGDAVILEHAPSQQRTRFDIEAASVRWRLPVVEPSKVHGRAGRVEHFHRRGLRPIAHVVNRVIPHSLPAGQSLAHITAAEGVTWHSHPSGYERIHKGVLAHLDLGDAERCCTADRWRDLGRDASELVVKKCTGFGGAQVELHVDADRLDSLPGARDWIVQPRYAPYPLFEAPDGAPVSGEIRCMVALPPDGPAWMLGNIVRLTRGVKASRAAQSDQPGEGCCLLYSPVEEPL